MYARNNHLEVGNRMMLTKLINYFHKTYALVRHLLANFYNPIFKLVAIDSATNVEDSLVHFENNITKQQHSKNLGELYKNKNLIKHFSNIEAAQIGYYYGKLLAYYEN